MINAGGVENVLAGGMARGTTINNGGVENVLAGGMARGTTINNGGVENVSGLTDFTTIKKGGVESVTGVSDHTMINAAGRETVLSGGTARDTTINTGGVETVENGGTADNVIFSNGATLQLETPLGLKGAILDWQVSDLIDFLNTRVTSVDKTGNKLTVTYDDHKTTTYKLTHQQADTQFQLQDDGHGGTNLTLEKNAVGNGHPNDPPGPEGNPNHDVSVIGIADAAHGHGHGLV
jgi:autotransporter passenger strand-loop-strand repeat protein